MKRKFNVNTVSGTYIISQSDIEFLKNHIGDINNLQIFEYEKPLLNMGGMRNENKPYKLCTYAHGNIPIGMEERVDKFNEQQQNLFYGYWQKLAHKINFSGTQIYLTHKKYIKKLNKISKYIATLNENFDLLEEINKMRNHEEAPSTYLPYEHICNDILIQINKGIEGDIVEDIIE